MATGRQELGREEAVDGGGRWGVGVEERENGELSDLGE